ncbi:hypothetical protein JXD38_12565 [candidate division WOR-3 bacterium]|nr:hypothetical protein [candidate division WOR-3 bacterium]
MAGRSGHYGLGLSVSAQGAIGVSWLNPDYPWYVFLASNRGDSWDYDSTGLAVTGPGPAFVAHDTAGVASIVYTCTDGGGGCSVVRARLVDSLWSTDTIRAGGGWSATFYCHEYLINTRDSASLLFVLADAFPDPKSSRPWYYQDLYVAKESAGSWGETRKAHAWYNTLGAMSMALDSAGAPQACWRDTLPMFRYEGIALDTQAYNSSIAIDRLNRPCVAYTRPELTFAYRGSDNQWRASAVSDATNSGSSLSIVLNQDDEPLVAYSTPDGLWLAHGVDVVGQGEEKRGAMAIGPRLTVTVVRNVLQLSDSESSVGTALFDMGGRRVADLHSGTNDVSGLAPGVYFMREEPQASSHKPQAITRVVITR